MVIERFLTYVESEKRYSPLTLRNYKRDLDLFLQWLGVSQSEEFDPMQITHHTIREWIVERMDSGVVAATTLNRELSTLRSFFKWALSNGIIPSNPTRGIHALKCAKKLPTFIPASKMNQVNQHSLDKSDSNELRELRDGLILILFYATGIRSAELVAINVDDFSDDFRTLKVKGKGGKQRMIPIVEAVRSIILQYISKLKEQNICIYPNFPLFLSKPGKRISANMVYRIVRHDLSESGVQGRKSPHVLRHTFATQLLNGGADMREIQELLGHSSLQATQLYTHNSISTLCKSYQSAHPRGGKVNGGDINEE